MICLNWKTASVEPEMSTGLCGSEARVPCTKAHCTHLDYHSTVRKSSHFVCSLIQAYVEELGPCPRLKERWDSKSVLLKILMEEGGNVLFFLTHIFLMLLS